MGVRLIADSTADIDPKRAEEWDVSIVPLKVIFGEEEFRDGVDLSLDEFYDRLERSETIPSTSQPEPQAFLKLFEEIRDAGDEAVVFTISAKLSGTWQSACLARELSGYDKIYIVDSLQVTLALQMMVRRALAMRSAGKTGNEIFRAVEAEKQRYRLFGVVDDLKYLYKGGRLSKATAVAGTMLDLKPVIEIRDGIVRLAGMARGMNGAYKKILRLIEEEGGLDESMERGVGYAKNREDMESIRQYLDGKLDLSDCLENRIGTVIGTHGGVGVRIFVCVLKP